jgi:hypothetical protein
MSDLLTALRLVISGDSVGAVAALDKVAMASGALGTKTDELAAKQAAAAKSGHAGLLLMAGGAGLVTAAVLGTVDAYAKQAEAVIQVQKQTGASAKWSSDFVVQAQALGVSTDSIGTSLGRMAKNVQGYEQGTTKATSAIGVAFKDLGISADSLKGADAGKTIDMIRDKLSKMPAGFERDYVMQSLFGRGAAGNPDLMRFLTATQGQLNAINKQAKDFGLVFTQKQLDQATKYGEEMRMLKIEFEGIAVSMGKELAPDLAAGGKAVGDLLRLFNAVPNSIKPILMLTPGFLMMGVGIYKVEQATVGLSKAGYSAVQMVRAFITSRRAATVATTEATTATEGETGATVAETGALKAGIFELGLYGIAIGVAMGAIYEIVKAYEKWAAAAQQAAQAASQANSNLAAAQAAGNTAGWGTSALPGSQSAAQIQAAIARDQYHAPSTAGWVGGAVSDYATKLVEPWKWFAEGGSFLAKKPSVIGVGERGTERVTVTPLGKGGQAGAGGGIHIDLRGAHFSAHSPRELADQVGDVIMGRIVGNMAASNA